MASFVLVILKYYEKLRQILKVIENEIHLFFPKKQDKTKKGGNFKKDLCEEYMLQADSWKR